MIGFISPLTEDGFCGRCNRMRLTATGKLRPCLLTDHGST
jgi:cyclic pyranopterin phosphate synthase